VQLVAVFVQAGDCAEVNHGCTLRQSMMKCISAKVCNQPRLCENTKPSSSQLLSL